MYKQAASGGTEASGASKGGGAEEGRRKDGGEDVIDAEFTEK
jgi:hypothetical protein